MCASRSTTANHPPVPRIIIALTLGDVREQIYYWARSWGNAARDPKGGKVRMN
jgi:hypothetical protein